MVAPTAHFCWGRNTASSSSCATGRGLGDICKVLTLLTSSLSWLSLRRRDTSVQGSWASAEMAELHFSMVELLLGECPALQSSCWCLPGLCSPCDTAAGSSPCPRTAPCLELQLPASHAVHAHTCCAADLSDPLSLPNWDTVKHIRKGNPRSGQLWKDNLILTRSAEADSVSRPDSGSERDEEKPVTTAATTESTCKVPSPVEQMPPDGCVNPTRVAGPLGTVANGSVSLPEGKITAESSLPVEELLVMKWLTILSCSPSCLLLLWFRSELFNRSAPGCSRPGHVGLFRR